MKRDKSKSSGNRRRTHVRRILSSMVEAESVGRDPNSGKFQPGHSGNKKGRPKKKNTVDAAITDAYAETVPVTENGKRRKISKLAITAKQIANKSAAGDPRMVKLGLELAQKAQERNAQSGSPPEQLSESDWAIVDRLKLRIRKITEEENNE